MNDDFEVEKTENDFIVKKTKNKDKKQKPQVNYPWIFPWLLGDKNREKRENEQD